MENREYELWVEEGEELLKKMEELEREWVIGKLKEREEVDSHGTL